RAHRRRDRGRERLGPPMKQQAYKQEQKDVVVQLQQRGWPFCKNTQAKITKAQNANDDRQEWTVLQPFPRLAYWADFASYRQLHYIHIADVTRIGLSGRRIIGQRH